MKKETENLRRFKEEVKTKIQSSTYLDGSGNEHTAYTVPKLFDMIDNLYNDFIKLLEYEDLGKGLKKEKLIPKYKKGDKVYYSYLHNGIVSGKVDKICATYTYCIDAGKSWHLVTEQELYSTEEEAKKHIEGK